MPGAKRLGERVDWLLNDRVHRVSALETFRARFVAIASLMGTVVAVTTGPLEWWLGDWGGLVTLASAAFSLAAVGMLRLGRSASSVFWVLVVVTAARFLGATLVEDHLDWTMVMWFSLLPLLAALFGGFRFGAYGLAIAVAGATLTLLLQHHHAFPRGPVPASVPVIRAAGFFVSTFSVAAAFDALRALAIDRAEQGARSRTLFLANMSHELRTPMNGVIGITEILLAEPQPESTRHQLELIQRSGQQMVALVNDILDLTRLESGRVAVERLPTSLSLIVSDVRALLQPIADNKGISLVSEVADDVPEAIVSDPTRVRQVLTNLAANAVKFTQSGRVTLTVSRRGPKLRCEVADTGIGMSPEVQRRLFQPFEQADVSYTRRYGGSGLGLALSQRLVVLLGGSLQVQSTEGVGTTMAFELPVEVTAPLSAAPPAPLTWRGQSRRVLLVEDNPLNRHVALALLEKCGCQTQVACDGDEALTAVHREPFDLVLMDCHMPNVDGFEATRRIRALGGTVGQVPIVALTASALAEDLSHCREAGMDDVLTKPLTLVALRQALERATAMSA